MDIKLLKELGFILEDPKNYPYWELRIDGAIITYKEGEDSFWLTIVDVPLYNPVPVRFNTLKEIARFVNMTDGVGLVVSRPSNEKYRNGWDLIFGKKDDNGKKTDEKNKQKSGRDNAGNKGEPEIDK